MVISTTYRDKRVITRVAIEGIIATQSCKEERLQAIFTVATVKLGIIRVAINQRVIAGIAVNGI
jgi:hypothetical protein